MSYQNTRPATKMRVGDRFGTLAVRQVLCGADAGWPCGGAFCWVRCDCGCRRLVRARHLRAGLIKTCARQGHSDTLPTSARVAHRLQDATR